MLKLNFVINVKPGRTMLKILLILLYILERELFLTYMFLNIWHNNYDITSCQLDKGCTITSNMHLNL